MSPLERLTGFIVFLIGIFGLVWGLIVVAEGVFIVGGLLLLAGVFDVWATKDIWKRHS